jgi:ribose transport system permease protein
LIITKYKVQPFLATLFTGSIITGIRMILVGIESAGNVPDMIRVFGRGRTLTIPNGLIIFFIVACIATFVMNRSIYGRKLIAVGTNFIAAEFSGIKADNTVIMSYIICSVLSVIASILLAGYIGFADRWIGAGLHFNSLVAAVIGGNYFGGGRGSVFGAVGGALIMTIVINFVTLLGFSAPYQHVVSGVVLILTLFIGTYSKRSQQITN